MTDEALLSSDYQEWETPPKFFNYLDAEFDFTLDPCCRPATAKCDKYYTPEDDGLAQSWEGERAYVNPPYGREISDWVEKCFRERNRAEVVVLLIPSRTDTRYWHDYVMKADEIRFVKGRLSFLKNGETQTGSTFPSAVVVFQSEDTGLPALGQILDWENKTLPTREE